MRAMTRAWVGLGLVVCCVAWQAHSAAAQSGSINISRAADPILRLDPLQRANIPFRISATAEVDTIAIRVDRPTGWRGVAPPALVLPRDSLAVRILSFMVPPDAPAGRYTLRLHAISPAGGSAVDSVTVIVGAKIRLEVDVEEVPLWVVPADTFAVKFRVFNRGNVPVVADMRLEARAGIHIKPSTAARRLSPGESYALVIGAIPEDGHVSGSDRVVSLTVSAGAYKKTAVARVDVLGDANADRARGLPGSLRLRMTDAADRPSLRLNADGPIREGSEARAHILIQGPHRRYSMFSERDVYRAALESRNFALRLGDYAYALSPLTSTGQQRTGAGADIRLGPFAAGGFFNWNRRSHLRSHNRGAFARIHAGNTATLGINWLQQEEAIGTREVASATATIGAPGGWLNADGEYALRYKTNARAYSVRARTTFGAFTAEVRRLRADSAFDGSQGGSTLDAAHVAVRPRGRFFMEATAAVRGSERPAFNSFFSNTTRSSRVTIGFGHVMSIIRQESMLHDSPWSQTDRMAQSAGARLRVALGGLALTPQVEIGRSRDYLTGTDGRFWRAASSASITTSKASYNGQFEYFTGGSLHSAAFGDGMRASFSADVRPTPFTRFGISANGARYFDDPEYRSVFASAALEHRLSYGHTIVLRTGFRATGERFQHHEFVIGGDYRILFRIPLLGGRTTGSICGRIYDSESGAPLVRAIVNANGRRIATGDDGSFEIRGLAPGAYRVRVNPGTAGHRIMAEQLQPIDVRSGATSTTDIPMIAGARLRGTVLIERSSSTSRIANLANDSATEPVSGAVVELRMGTEQVRREADEYGRFDFADLRPGRWAAFVVSAKLPPHFRFKPDTVFAVLQPSTESTIEFRAASVDRPVRMLTVVPTIAAVQDSARRTLKAPPISAAHTQPRSRPKITPDSATGWTVFNVPAYMKDLREVARVVYLETGLWPKIWLANRDAVPDPDQLKPGTALRIPPRSPLSSAELEALREYMRTRW